MFTGKALKERRFGGATDEHEDVIGRRIHVWGPPRFDGKAIAFGSEHDGVAGGHVGVVECESFVSVVNVEDPIGSRAYVEHEDVVHAEEEVSKTRMATPVLQSKWVVYGDVSAEGSAGIDVG